MRQISDRYRAWALIDTDALARNARYLRALCVDRALYAAVKADGYGHGAVQTARAVEKYADGYCVACAEEGVALRKKGIAGEILILGEVPPAQCRRAIADRLSCAVWRQTQIETLSHAAQALNMRASVHFAVDCGMSRLGIAPSDESARWVCRAASTDAIEPRGVFTHLPVADCDAEKTRAQIAVFHDFLRRLNVGGCALPYHFSASAALLNGLSVDGGVRAGIALYGVSPDGTPIASLAPAMRFCSRIVDIRAYPPGREIGYGGTFVTRRESRIATLSVGYGDGYPRSLSNRAFVSIDGARAPVVGRVCMDMTMIDVTDCVARVGDTATLWGSEGLRAEEVAASANLSAYELICGVSARVKRIYVGKNAHTV